MFPNLRAFAAHTPDLIVAECDISQFAIQFGAYRERSVAVLRGEGEAWTAMDRKNATPALWFAPLGGVPLVFVFDQSSLPSEVLALHLDFKRVSFVPAKEAADPVFLERAAYRLDAGLLPVRVVHATPSTRKAKNTTAGRFRSPSGRWWRKLSRMTVSLVPSSASATNSMEAIFGRRGALSA